MYKTMMKITCNPSPSFQKILKNHHEINVIDAFFVQSNVRNLTKDPGINLLSIFTQKSPPCQRAGCHLGDRYLCAGQYLLPGRPRDRGTPQLKRRGSGGSRIYVTLKF